MGEYFLGLVTLLLGDPSSAKRHYLRGVEQAERIGFARLLQICYEPLATLALMENDMDQAQQYALKSLRISRDNGQTREMLAFLRDLARVNVAQASPETALQLLAVVLNHPSSEQNSINRPERLRDEAEKLRAQIESQLDPALYKAAWQAGQQRDLPDVMSQILNHGSVLSPLAN
jgi:hypothetical protein